MTIPLEKILTISAKDYAEIYGKNLSNYKAIGVHTEERYFDEWSFLKRFAKGVPDNAEVVVDFRQTVAVVTQGDFKYLASGTALIPKKE